MQNLLKNVKNNNKIIQWILYPLTYTWTNFNLWKVFIFYKNVYAESYSNARNTCNHESVLFDIDGIINDFILSNLLTKKKENKKEKRKTK